MTDNELTAHVLRAFEGERKIPVATTQLIGRVDTRAAEIVGSE